MSINDGYMPGKIKDLHLAPSSMLASREQNIISQLKNKDRPMSVTRRKDLKAELRLIQDQLLLRVGEPAKNDADRLFLDHLDKIIQWPKSNKV